VKTAVIIVSVGALLADLALVTQADAYSLPCILLGWLLVPLAAVLGAIYAANARHGWWALVLVLLAILAVIGTLYFLGVALRCFDLYGDSCQQPSPTEMTEAIVAIIVSLVVPPVASLIAAFLIAPSSSASTATPAEEASAVPAGGTAAQAESQAEPPASSA
jgi:hypothetical protein